MGTVEPLRGVVGRSYFRCTVDEGIAAVRLVRQHGWRRPRLRVHPTKPKTGLRTTRANEMWPIDTTIICLLEAPAPICLP